MRVALALTVASLKMYFRNRQALFFALFLPLLIMVVFGIINFGDFAEADIGVVDAASNEASAGLVEGLVQAGEGLANVERGGLEEETARLEAGDIDALFVIPEGFGAPGSPATVQVRIDQRSQQQASLAVTLLDQVLDDLFLQIAEVPPEYRVESRFRIDVSSVQGDDKSYTTFLVPGVVALSIMQLGIFSVVFALVQFRQQGVLRRLRAAPISPAHFLFAQVSTRLTISVLQTLILLTVGLLVFGVAVGDGGAGSWLLVTVLALVGGALFVTMGLAISGFAKTEEVAAPVTNLVAMPMMFLSGVFFPLDTLPGVVSAVTRFLPLTFLANAIRAVVTDGAGLADISSDLAGMGAWVVVVFLAAVRLFRWE